MERYAYLYPLSRDVELYHRLVEQVSRYRAVLGQPDQEELLRLLGSKVDAGALAEEDLRELFVNLCPLVWQRDAGEEGQPCVTHFTSGQYCRVMRHDVATRLRHHVASASSPASRMTYRRASLRLTSSRPLSRSDHARVGTMGTGQFVPTSMR